MSLPRNKYLRRIDNLGFVNFLRYTAHQKTGLPKRGEFALRSRLVDVPLLCRGGSSDIDVFKHIFVLREYAEIRDLPSQGLIVDCGANVGFSTVYFLSQCPQAHVVAVEPDPQNFEMLERNTATFGNRVTRVKAGLWSAEGGLRVVDAPAGDGRAWARGVELVQAGEPADVPAVSVGTLLERSAYDRVALLKVDIEGAEEVVFGAGAQDWLPFVDRIAIELHGPACERVFLEAAGKAGFRSQSSGGLMLAQRPE